MKKTNQLPEKKVRTVYEFGQTIRQSGLSTTDTDPTSPASLTSTHIGRGAN